MLALKGKPGNEIRKELEKLFKDKSLEKIMIDYKHWKRQGENVKGYTSDEIDSVHDDYIMTKALEKIRMDNGFTGEGRDPKKIGYYRKENK